MLRSNMVCDAAIYAPLSASLRSLPNRLHRSLATVGAERAPLARSTPDPSAKSAFRPSPCEGPNFPSGCVPHTRQLQPWQPDTDIMIAEEFPYGQEELQGGFPDFPGQ